MVTAVVPPKLPMRQSNGVSAPGTWAPQLLLLQTSLPYSLPFSVLSTGTAVRRVLPGIGVCGAQGREGRARRRKGSNEKENPLPEPGISFYHVHPTVIRQDHSFPCGRHLFEG